MEKHIQTLLNRFSFASITIATITLIYLLSQTPETCLSDSNPNTQIRFPKSSCDSTHRELVSIEKKNKRIWSTNDWHKKVTSFQQFFNEIENLGFLGNQSKVICVSAGAGQEVMALSEMGVIDVTGVELVDSPPLVSKADPHNLPFFDGVFDLGFSAHFAEALFPLRFVSEMERMVRIGGFCIIVLQDCFDDDLKEIKGLFRRSSFVSAENVSLIGLKMTRIIMRRIKSPP
ncbi:hypothetical protein AQUCO_02800258v1 [Aquilegia coerulea]|uniref:Methyltransferase type 11 domain-containing protein n=1 Tax=Aquilegia coerulea TaxID=218851 RepID=A0A2G5D4K4_AQUCA|nr:hypothetical protein AQUCO_02800258v1 [Aquilegia coerulea]